jgi:hypothetical protein
LLDGLRHNTEQQLLWNKISAQLSTALKGGKCRVEAVLLSPTKQRMAVCSEWKTLFGLRVHQVGAIFDFEDNAIVGRIAEGKRGKEGWVQR